MDPGFGASRLAASQYWPRAHRNISDVTGREAAAGTWRVIARVTRWTARLVRGEVVKRVGGPARARVITMFGAVLALSGADAATVGAVAPQLEHSLHIGNTKIGLLTAVSLLVGAIFTIPVGLLVDRIKRIPMLSISIILCGASRRSRARSRRTTRRCSSPGSPSVR